MSNRVDVQWIHLRETHPGTSCAAAQVNVPDGEFEPIVVALNGRGQRIPASGFGDNPSRLYYDGSVHRTISDLTRLIGPKTRIIAAGDLNVTNPQRGARPTLLVSSPTHGRLEVAVSLVVATAVLAIARRGTTRLKKETPSRRKVAAHYVFASTELEPSVRALNCPWGPSDHCAIRIDVKSPCQDDSSEPLLRRCAADVRLSSCSTTACSGPSARRSGRQPRARSTATATGGALVSRETVQPRPASAGYVLLPGPSASVLSAQPGGAFGGRRSLRDGHALGEAGVQQADDPFPLRIDAQHRQRLGHPRSSRWCSTACRYHLPRRRA